MAMMSTKPQPEGTVKHGKHCEGGIPGWHCCEACAIKQVRLCRAFWETMGGVPEVVMVHTTERLAWYSRKQVKVRPVAFVETA
jgi:hypothetical protein